MGTTVYFQISLVAAFVAGMVALFAPCCISYLLPVYLGNIFKERKHILFMTMIYSLGIFVVMLPVVLGAKALSMLFFNLHDQTYYIGGMFMILVAFFSLLGIKFPMPHFSMNKKGGNDVISIFILGIISGITSSCCAPVLIGVITLSTLTPTVFQSLGVGFSYVLGMVAPLYIASAFIKQRNILEKPVLRRKITTLTLGKKTFPILVSNIVAASIFFITGMFTIFLNAAGLLAMPTSESSIIKMINNTSVFLTQKTKMIPVLNLLFIVIIVYFLYRYIKKVQKEQ